MGRSDSTERLPCALTLLVWLVCVLFLSALTLADPDLWGHTLYGLRAMDLGILTERTDPFSYTVPGGEWINHEWASEYELGLAWRLLGNVGLILWRNALVAGVLLLALVAIRRAGAGLATATLLLVIGAEVLSDFVVFVRPQVTTFFCFAAFLFILQNWWQSSATEDGAGIGQPSRWLFLIPLIMVAWVNHHGGFLAGVGVLGIYCVGAVVRAFVDSSQIPAARQMVAVSLLTVAATFVNPYCWKLHAMLWDHLWTTQLVREWRPVWAAGPSPVLAAPFLIAAFAFLFSRRRSLIDFIVLLVIGWQAVSHLRHVALLCIAVMVLLPAQVEDALQRLFPLLRVRWSGVENLWKQRAAVAAVSVFLMGLQVQTSFDLWRHGVAPWNIAVENRSYVPGMPTRTLVALQQLGVHGNLVTDYGWGQFAIWYLFPESHVAFDGRYRTVYPAEIEQKLIAFQKAGDDLPRVCPLIDDVPTEIALLPVKAGTTKYLDTRADWVCVYRDDQAALFLRDLPQFARQLRQVSQFTGGLTAIPDVPRWTVFPGAPERGTTVAIGWSEDGLPLRGMAAKSAQE
ncbi:hypothetical protein GC176_05710 [bacterium]|nr:hypothetical protein [bacterium]